VNSSSGRPDAVDRYPDAVDGYNAGYAESLYESELRSRGLIPPSLADWLGAAGSAAAPDSTRSSVQSPFAGSVAASEEQLRTAAVAGALVESYRDHGHLAVQLDPLGTPPPGHPALKPEFHGTSEADLATLPAGAIGLEKMGATALDVIRSLAGIYCDRIGYELDHMENPAQRDWLTDYIESGRHRAPLERAEAIALLRRLGEVEGLERFLHRSYLGKKRFSIEGLDMLVPMLDRAILSAAAAGTVEIPIGMAHRGRLNVLTHLIGRPYEAVLAEFEGARSRGLQTNVPESGAGDVKYHLGARGTVQTEYGPVEVYLVPNPSHLEHVNPVLEGVARGTREWCAAGGACGVGRAPRPRADAPEEARAYRNRVLPVLIHGDAAFIGQGVVAETLNLCRLPGYETGGTLHVIANNQLGFTTLPRESRSTRYASDLALGFRLPVVHVNADDPEACLAAIRLAVDYRIEFGEDIVVDLVGYRKYGHNEGDEPGYTQPLMYEKIRRHPSVREQWEARLLADGVVTEEQAAQIVERVARRLNGARAAVTGQHEAEGREDAVSEALVSQEHPRGGLTEESDEGPTETAVSAERLEELNAGIHTWPADLRLFRKLDRQLERRRAALHGEIDWAHAEALAFASLVTSGIPVRLSGEDVARATFSQRHLVLHDVERGTTYTPLRHLAPDQASFEVWNSPLSEVAVLGFEYGYSTVATHMLVLWEAQFGDFANVAQAITDQFLVSGRTKWGQESRLVLLLPHGYEGQGPEHSSARLERFLQLSAEHNIRVVNCTTPAQYFHLLRLQALRTARRPLVVMTPKSLLRHPGARSRLEDLTTGTFRPVLQDDEALARREQVTRILLCSGKVYYDLRAAAAPIGKAVPTGQGTAGGGQASAGDDAPLRRDRAAVIRVERLYPFPETELREALAEFPNAAELVWVQEEPANMGGWSHVSATLHALAGERGRTVRYVGRPRRASPAEGYAAEFKAEQTALIREALAGL